MLPAWQEVQEAFDASANGSDYAWQLLTARKDDYNLRMVRFVGDSAGDEITDQWTKQPVMFYQDALSLEGCFDPIVGDTLAASLFEAGYDVFIACRRGQGIEAGSNPNSLSDEDFFDFTTQEVGEEDIKSFMEKINGVRNDGALACKQTAIITGQLSVQEVLSAAVAYPTDFNTFVSNVLTRAPCLDTNLDTVGESPLRALTSTDVPDELYWSGVESLCEAYPDACYDYCDIFPDFCDEFCIRFPQFCRPDWVDDFEQALNDLRSLGYYALYKDDDGGLTWAQKVDEFCLINDGRWCDYFTGALIYPLKPVSLKQFE